MIIEDKRLRMPKVDLKKKPTFELLRAIGKGASQDIAPHPFMKAKPPKGIKIEEIFIKQSGPNVKKPNKENNKENNKESNKKKIKKTMNKNKYKKKKS